MTINTQIPKVCRAAPAIDIGSNDYKIVLREDYPVPEPKENELLVELKVSGVCQSDHHFINGDWKMNPLPGVDCTGHEGAGYVAKVGSAVKGWNVGDRVGITPVSWTCDECECCKSGHETICPDKQFVASVCNGTYTQYPTINADWAIKLPDNVPWEQLAPFMCSGGTAYTAAKAAELKAGETLAVFGAGGGVGHMVVQFATAMGHNVIGIDVGEEKRAVATEAGAKHFIDVTKTEDVGAAVKKLTPDGKGAHACIVAAGNAKAYVVAPTVLRNLGLLVALGHPPVGTSVAGADPFYMCVTGIRAKGILVATRAAMAEALEFLKDGKVKEHVTLVPFSEFPQALADVAASRTQGRKVVDFNK